MRKKLVFRDIDSIRNNLRRHGFVREGDDQTTSIQRAAHPVLHNRLAEHEILAILDFASKSSKDEHRYKSELAIRKSCFLVKRDEVHKYLSDLIKMGFVKKGRGYLISRDGKEHLEHLREVISNVGLTVPDYEK